MANSKLIGFVGALCLVPFATVADTPTDDNGNRYNKDRVYHSEISASDAYLQMMQNKATVLDVRRLREYAAGHPDRAYNVPYPHIIGSRDQTSTKFYWEVYKIAKGDVDRALLTLCRTGSRSVDAANILADPLNTAGDPNRVAVAPDPMLGDPVPFNNVRNIWEGFVGQWLYAFDGGDLLIPPVRLDLNNDGVLSDDAADVYPHTKDANPDKDGWRNFRSLPWSTHILKPRAYEQDVTMYECYTGNCS